MVAHSSITEAWPNLVAYLISFFSFSFSTPTTISAKKEGVQFSYQKRKIHKMSIFILEAVTRFLITKY